MMLVVFKSSPILKRTLKVRHAMMQLYVLKLLKMQTRYLGRQWRKTNMKTISAIYSKVRHRLNDDWAFGNGNAIRLINRNDEFYCFICFTDLDARPWDFQAEECTLRTCVDRFNNRRYLSGNSGAINRTATGNGSGNGGGGGGGGSGAGSGGNGSGGNGGQPQNCVGPPMNYLIGYENNAADVNFNNATGEPNDYAQAGYGGWDNGVVLTEEFKQQYEIWLQEEVFSYQVNWDSFLDYKIIEQEVM